MNEVVIRPLRFTADVPAMRAFLETLGLRSRIESERGGWVDMVAGRGMVALHDSAASSTGGRSGETRLAFEADDVDELKERFDAAGYEGATVFDEAFGRVFSVVGPENTVIWVDERSKDLYGYKLHDAQPDPRWEVTPRLSVGDQAAWLQFLELLGGDNVDLVRFGPPAAEFEVRLEFGTTEAMAEVAQRLTAAGYQPEQVDDGLTIIDPDGQTVRVHGES
ncbi:MAG: hypothetical protein QOF10_3776 [Kribbellaceae bacterium]|jgi:hypothetical protein|nr:hypothetical protein [Kribbellaceae bacterium]